MIDHTDEHYLERFGELPTSLRVHANGTELHLLQWGDPAAQPIFLIHGMRAHARWFTPVGPALAPRFRALSVDLRGHGESAHTPPFGPRIYADDIAALVDALALERPILLGHSMGGGVAVNAAARLGPRLRALVLVDAGLGPPPRPSWRGLPRASDPAEREPTTFATWEAARARFKLRPGETVAAPDLLEHLARHAIVELPDGRFSWRFDPNLRQLAAAPSGPPDAAAIRCPVLSIWGAQSPILQRVDPRDIAERFPSATWTSAEIIDGAHHHVFLDQPEAFNATLLKHLTTMLG